MIKDIRTVLDSKSCETERGLAFLDVLNVVSGKWKMVLICIIQQDKLRFTTIQQLIPNISPRMLSRELKELELNGIIERTVFDTKPVTIEYSITDSAKNLVPVIMELVAWGVGHRKQTIMREQPSV